MTGPKGYCATCNNTGMVDCYCGGDLCVCDNYGEEPCPDCDGGGDLFCEEIEDEERPEHNIDDFR